MLNPSRIEFARTRRRWTKVRLAEELGVRSRTIQGYEAGEYEPEPERLAQLAELLRFPISFFFGPDLPKISEHTASFRSMSRMPAALRDSALNAGSLAFVLNHWIESRFSLPQAELPDLSDLSPEDAAATLRRIWGFGQAPISNMIHLLESKGIRVYSLAIEAREVDAFSVWHENTPFVFLNTFKSAEHSRFDAGHELGHLVRDRYSMLHSRVHGPEKEREANAFASAFLMPHDDVVARRPLLVTVPQLIKLKSYWGVSLAALAYRMNSLELVTEWTYRTLCIEIAKKGYRTTEPNPILQETSQMLGKVFDRLRREGIGRAEIANELSLTLDDLNALTFMLTLSSVRGPETGEANVVSTFRSAKLRLVR
jgi:Zn-dependent peptidase ImmA (M78 family)/DNA-binding XRE family transcriptional regulator